MEYLEEEEEELMILSLLLLSREKHKIKQTGNVCKKRKEMGDFDQIHIDLSDSQFR